MSDNAKFMMNMTVRHRNHYAQSLSDPKYRKRVVRNRKAYTRKSKHQSKEF